MEQFYKTTEQRHVPFVRVSLLQKALGNSFEVLPRWNVSTFTTPYIDFFFFTI